MILPRLTLALQIEQVGIEHFDAMAPVGLLMQYLSAKLYHGKTLVHLHVQGRLVKPASLVRALDGEIIRMTLFPQRGGTKFLVSIESDLQDLLQQHGVPRSEVKSRANQVVLALGLLFASKSWHPVSHGQRLNSMPRKSKSVWFSPQNVSNTALALQQLKSRC